MAAEPAETTTETTGNETGMISEETIHFANAMAVATEFIKRVSGIYSIRVMPRYESTPIHIHVKEAVFVDIAAEGLFIETTTRAVCHVPNHWMAHYDGILVFKGVRINLTSCEPISQEAADAIIASAVMVVPA